jgi:hypothetical protein
MSDKKTPKKEIKPFFALFLEGMDKEEMERITGGRVTRKYPSDKDEPN